MTANSNNNHRIEIPANKSLEDWITELLSDYSPVYVSEKIRAAVVPDVLTPKTAPMFSEIFARLSLSLNQLKTDRIVLLGNYGNMTPSGLIFCPPADNPVFENILPSMDLLTIAAMNPVFREASREDTMFARHFEPVLPFIQRLFPHAELLPLLADGTKDSKISKALRNLDLGKSDLLIAEAVLSTGLSRVEASNKDAAIMASILAQEDIVTVSDTSCYNLINALSRYSLRRRLVPHIFKNNQVNPHENGRMRVNGYVSIGYLM
ncbi:hypothetical protein [Succinimonas amylolytica]|uniref:hypothetical protein n=1 Tax=Succinimonas amylolytica TaxID=83769 RepID=UPI00035EFAEC|nr:hypothetical protein [Succinimonas amylolytica]